jgi:branched-chain amino acid transport system permease protein
MIAVGDDPTAARALGTNASWTLTVIFAVSSGLAAVAGIMQAQTSVILTPSNINLNVAIAVLAMVTVGGIRSIAGAVLGAVLLSLVPVVFAPVQEYATWIYAAVLLLVLLFSPRGLVGMGSDVLDRLKTRLVRR